MSTEDHSPSLTKKSEPVLEEGEITEQPVKKNDKLSSLEDNMLLSKKVDEYVFPLEEPGKKIISPSARGQQPHELFKVAMTENKYSKLKTKTESFMSKLHHKKPILEFMDTYFMQYIDFIVDIINSIVENKGIYCSFFLINSMVFYHEIKMSNPTEAYKYIRRYIRRRVDICMEKDNGYGKLPNQNKKFLKENDLDVKDFPIFTNYLESTHGCIFVDKEGRQRTELCKSLNTYRGRERERSPVAYRGRERKRSPVNYREKENPCRDRSWSRERIRRRYDEPEKEKESTIIKMLMDQNEKLMKMVSQGQGHVQQHVSPPFVLPPPPPIHYQNRPPVPYYPPPPPLNMMLQPPPLHQHYLPPTQYQQAPPREPPKDPRLFSMPYRDRE
jgi:hypothetical protein